MSLALITIGQAPREDVVASMFATVHTPFAEYGALDLLDEDDIATLAPASTDMPLVTRLRTGHEVVVGKHALMPHVQAALDRAVADGATTLAILCTGAFPALQSPVPCVYPDKVVSAIVGALLPAGTLGVVLPHVGQQQGMREKWSTDARGVKLAVASPYTAAESMPTAVRSLGPCDLIVLDCMGYDRQMLAMARSASTVPVLLSNGVMGAILGELVEQAASDGDQVAVG